MEQTAQSVSACAERQLASFPAPENETEIGIGNKVLEPSVRQILVPWAIIYVRTIYGKLLCNCDVPKRLVSHHPEDKGFASLTPIIPLHMYSN